MKHNWTVKPYQHYYVSVTERKRSEKSCPSEKIGTDILILLIREMKLRCARLSFGLTGLAAVLIDRTT